MKTPTRTGHRALATWVALNAFLMSCHDEKVLERLLKEERRGRCRQTFVMRIFKRINRLRVRRETVSLHRAMQPRRRP